MESGNVNQQATEHSDGKGSQLLSIGRAAKKAGVSRQSLQYYLMIGLLEPTAVKPSGRRLFDEAAIERIRLVRELNQSGYPLRAIRELFMERDKTNKESGK